MATFVLLLGFALVKVALGLVLLWLGLRSRPGDKLSGGWSGGGGGGIPPRRPRGRRRASVRRVARGRPARRPVRA